MTEQEARRMVMKVGDCRASITKKFELQWPEVDGEEQRAPLEVYMIVGLYGDNEPCAIFFYGNKVGEFEHGILSALAMSMSLALQHGCPLDLIIRKWTSTKFPPEGFSGDPDFPLCTSLLDLMGKWLKSVFCDDQAQG